MIISDVRIHCSSATLRPAKKVYYTHTTTLVRAGSTKRTDSACGQVTRIILIIISLDRCKTTEI